MHHEIVGRRVRRIPAVGAARGIGEADGDARATPCGQPGGVLEGGGVGEHRGDVVVGGRGLRLQLGDASREVVAGGGELVGLGLRRPHEIGQPRGVAHAQFRAVGDPAGGAEQQPGEQTHGQRGGSPPERAGPAVRHVDPPFRILR